MRLSLKITVSAVALTLSFYSHNALGMNNNLPIEINVNNNQESRVIFQQRELTTRKGLKVTVFEDTYPDSSSAIWFTEGKEKRQQKLRILSCDGGGVRGLYPIIELAVLEEILNRPENVEKKAELIKNSTHPDRDILSIRDLFDVGAGTSTGSILAGGLFSKQNYSTIELAKIYSRYGYKIFDEQKRTGGGFFSANYNNKGLKSLLKARFGNDVLQNDMHKTIYIVALNEKEKTAAIFSNHENSMDQLLGKKTKLHNTSVVKALLCSASAPTYFEAVKLSTNEGKIMMSDGGTVANNPSLLAYQNEKIDSDAEFEIYSFGTGTVPQDENRSHDSGLTSTKEIVNNTLAASENLALEGLISELSDKSTPLSYIARINPKLEEGMGELDDTSETYKKYSLQKALSVTTGQAFKNMVERLGFKMPPREELQQIHDTIYKKLDSLSSNSYKILDSYEKEYIIKKINNLDFKFYENRFYEDKDTGHLGQMTKEEADILLFNLMKELKERPKDFVSSMKGIEIPTVEQIQRGIEFHGISDNKLTLDEERFNILLLTNVTPSHKFTKAQLDELNKEKTLDKTEPNKNAELSNSNQVTSSWSPLSNWFSSPSSETQNNLIQESNQNKLVYQLFTTFTKCCEQGKYTYEQSNTPYLDYVALIFWKDTLKEIEGTLTGEHIHTIKSNLTGYIDHIKGSRAIISKWAAKKTHSSRYDTLVNALDVYSGKFLKKSSTQ